MTARARVSVVIPTCLRPDLVLRAVRSVLAQTAPPNEVIVVVDGGDAETVSALATVADARLRVHRPERRLGNADARNAGIALASGEWVAFLDDDDEWLPDKLAAQLSAAAQCQLAHPIVACRLIARDESGEFVWPRRQPRAGEHLSEYFFCRTLPFTGEGMVINSAVLTTRALAVRVPFRSGLERHVDPDWLLRAASEPDVQLVFPPGPEPLMVWHIERGRSRITTRRDWRQSLEFAQQNRALFTAPAYAAFVLHVVGSSAAAQGESAAFPLLLREAFREGRPAPVDLLSHAANFLLPLRLQRVLARAYARLRRPRPSADPAA